MADERLRIPIDDPYLRAVGRATICFARLEWTVVWCAERIRPGYIGTTDLKTAGRIANDLVDIAQTHPDASIAASLASAAAQFKQLVSRRNDLMHARPGTAPTGDQRLFRHGAEWTIPQVEQLSDDFAAAEMLLNDYLHNLL